MRTKTDGDLGTKVYNHLRELRLETLVNPHNARDSASYLEQGIKSFLQMQGLNIEDPSLQDTPRRVAEMFAYELCAGLDYANFPKCTATPNGTPVFDQVSWDAYIEERLHAWNTGSIKGPGSFTVQPKTRAEVEAMHMSQEKRVEFTATIGHIDEMVMLDSITTTSLCEHHFQTIAGKTHIAYIPGPKILGVSKFARVANFFGRRPQIQERMTEQIYAALSLILETEDVAVQQVCAHHCIRSRGAMDPHSLMTTSKLGGKFKSNPALRAEFLHGIN